MAIDRKYGAVTLERGSVAADEPVVVFRAQDRLLPDLLDVYEEMCELAGSPPAHLEGIRATRERIVDWQDTHHTQTPQSDPESL